MSKEGRVTLKIDEAEQSGSVLIHIQDSGIGIKESRRDQLFQPFNRLGLEGGTIEGSGVGLSITKTLVELMGGEINYTPNSPQGSCFTVTLKAEQPVDAFPEKPFQSTEKRDKPAPDARKTILYIEDHPANLKLVAQILSRYESIKLLSAPTGERGIEQARRQVPDLVLLDINMPEMDGYQTLKALRQLPGLASTPVFALTACSMLEEKERAEQAGFDDFITKPIEVEAFLAAVSRALDV